MVPKLDDLSRLYGRNISEEEYHKIVELYNNARNNHNLFCLMGRREDINVIVGTRDDEYYFEDHLLHNGNTANFCYTDEEQSGNVLSTNNWSIAMNDAWVLGGIEGGSIFNMVYNFPSGINTEEDLDRFIQNVIFSHQERFPHTVTAREILALKAAQYIPMIENGTLFFVPSREGVTLPFDHYLADLMYNRIDTQAETSLVAAEIYNYLKAALPKK